MSKFTILDEVEINQILVRFRYASLLESALGVLHILYMVAGVGASTYFLMGKELEVIMLSTSLVSLCSGLLPIIFLTKWHRISTTYERGIPVNWKYINDDLIDGTKITTLILGGGAFIGSLITLANGQYLLLAILLPNCIFLAIEFWYTLFCKNVKYQILEELAAEMNTIS